MIQIKTFSFNPFSENTYILYNAKRNAFLVDPGNLYPEETEVLQQFIAKNRLTIQNILLTHAHIDHVFGLQLAYNMYQVPVLIHPLEKEILERNSIDAQRFGFQFTQFKGELQFIKEGDEIYLDDNSLKVYHVPGHSPGSICYYEENDGFVISGDVLFQGSIGRTDLYKGNMAQLISSILNKLFTLPDATKVYPGHGECTTIVHEKRFNPFFS